MEYKDLLKAHLKFGTTKEDIIKRKGYEKILENVVIAPCWKHDIFAKCGFEVEQVGEKVFNFYSNQISFSYIELNRIGAPAITDYILALGVTKCRNLIFLGSVGSLDENIKIGDLIVPKYSVCGDGASRYLNDNLEDEIFKKEYPSKEITDNLIEVFKEENIGYHYVPNFSVDSIFAQFYFIDKIVELGCKTIEMETANLFKCNQLININVTALFCVSDNTVLNKSLYSGRTEAEDEYRHKVRYEVVPKVVVKLFKKLNK
ncbi:MAG: phosphorylase [Clostridia bacterium]|nr:phosphorylase [Clostridia bacterium]